MVSIVNSLDALTALWVRAIIYVQVEAERARLRNAVLRQTSKRLGTNHRLGQYELKEGMLWSKK